MAAIFHWKGVTSLWNLVERAGFVRPLGGRDFESFRKIAVERGICKPSPIRLLLLLFGSRKGVGVAVAIEPSAAVELGLHIGRYI